MNNIQRAFKRKGLADGGRPHPNMLGTGMAARAGGLLAGRSQQIEEAAEAATVAPQAAQQAPAGYGGLSARRDNATPPAHMLLAQRRGMADGGTPERKMKDPLQEAIKLHETHMENPATATMKSQRELMGLMRGHQAMMKNSGMADGGAPKRKPNGGLVRGPGGPTEDKAGLFRLSSDEYVLPVDTVDALGGPEVLDEVRDATHEFVDENNRVGLVNGGSVWEKARKAAGSAFEAGKKAVSGLGAARAVPAPELVSGGFTNAERAAATPAGYKTGGFAKPTPPPNRALRFAKGVGTKLVAPLAAGSAVLDSAAEDSTARYAQRFGVSEPTGDGSAGDVLKFAGLRAGGFATDLANNLTLGAAGKLYRDKPGGPVSKAATAPLPAPPPAAPVAPVQQAPNTAQPEVNTGLRAASTRADGRANSFSGVGVVDPADYQAAVARAEKDKSDLVSAAANYAAQGDRDNAYRLASGDPAATAAVEQAFQQRGLRQAALSGNKAAAEILAQQGRDASAERVANITASSAERVGLTKARADMAKAQADLLKDERAQRNADRSFGLQERTLGNAEGQQNQKNIQNALEGVLGPRALKDGVPNPAYADFETKLNETLLQGAAGADGKPRTMQNLSAAELQDFLRAYQLEKESAPGALGKAVNFLTGNSRAESNDFLLNAPRAGTAKEGLLYDTYQDGQGQVRRVGGLAGRDLTVEERRRVGLR